MLSPVFRRFAAFVILILVLGLVFGLSNLPACAEKPVPQQPTATASSQPFPPEAQQTLVLIHQNGPFPYERDGIAFGNREKLLPVKPRGYYREYTVPTPGARDRGARRIVCGGKTPSVPDLCYYTADHYQSFHPIHHETAQP